VSFAGSDQLPLIESPERPSYRRVSSREVVADAATPESTSDESSAKLQNVRVRIPIRLARNIR
jgi:hypothetical protein